MPRGIRSNPAASPDEVRPPIRTRKRKGGTLADRYALSDEMMADLKARGMSAEWKRETVAGMGDPSYDVFMREQGWEPVPGERYPEYVAEGHTGPIRRDGLILMERPVELTQEAMEEEKAAARDAVRIKEQQLGNAGAGEFQRHRTDGSSTVNINRTMERGGMEID